MDVGSRPGQDPTSLPLNKIRIRAARCAGRWGDASLSGVVPVMVSLNPAVDARVGGKSGADGGELAARGSVRGSQGRPEPGRRGRGLTASVRVHEEREHVVDGQTSPRVDSKDLSNKLGPVHVPLAELSTDGVETGDGNQEGGASRHGWFVGRRRLQQASACAVGFNDQDIGAGFVQQLRCKLGRDAVVASRRGRGGDDGDDWVLVQRRRDFGTPPLRRRDQELGRAGQRGSVNGGGLGCHDAQALRRQRVCQGEHGRGLAASAHDGHHVAGFYDAGQRARGRESGSQGVDLSRRR